jgi:hypothetical protein
VRTGFAVWKSQILASGDRMEDTYGEKDADRKENSFYGGEVLQDKESKMKGKEPKLVGHTRSTPVVTAGLEKNLCK